MTPFVDDGGTPDLFSMCILDRNYFPIQTTDPANSFLSVNLDSSDPVVNTYTANSLETPLAPANITVPAVPEISDAGFAVVLLSTPAFSRAGIRRRATAKV